MVDSCFSLVSFWHGRLRKTYASVGLEPRTFQLDHETTMHCWTPKTSSPPENRKPPLVLIHGFGPSAVWQWRYQITQLSGDFNVYVPDLIFFGQSMTESSDRSEIFQAVSVAKLMNKLNVEQFSVLGTSYGGFVAYHLARIYPETVEKVIIASSAVNKKREDNGKLVERAQVERISDLLLPKSPSQLRTLLTLSIHKTPYLLPNFLLNDVIENLYMDNREEKMQLLMGLTLGKDDTVEIAPLQQEVLIIWGEHDKIFPVEKAFELKMILGEKTRVEVMKNTSHVPQIENPKRFNAIVKNFLLSHVGPCIL